MTTDLDIAQRNDLRLAALARVPDAQRKELMLGRILEPPVTAGGGPAYFLEFGLVHDVKPAALTLDAWADLPLGARLDGAFGAAREVDTPLLRKFLLSPEVARLRGLDCRNVKIGSASTAFQKAEHMGGLTYLDVTGSSVKFAPFLAAKSLGGLRELAIGPDSVNADEVVTLLKSPNMARLTDLDILGVAGPDDLGKLGAVAELGRLTSLSMGDPEVEKSWMPLLESKHLGNIRRLLLWSNQLAEDAGPFLADDRMTKLEDLGALSVGNGFTRIGPPALKRLSIHVRTAEALRALAADPALGRLEHLRLRVEWKSQEHLQDLYASPGFRKLASFDLTVGGTVRSQDEALSIAKLPSFERLRRFRVSGLKTDETLLAAMLTNRPFRHIESLELPGNLGAGGARLLAEHADLVGLKRLDLQYAEVPDEGIAAFAASPHLRSLELLYLGKCRDDGMRALAQSKTLASLIALRLRAFASDENKALLARHANMPKLWVLDGIGNLDDPEMRGAEYDWRDRASAEVSI